MAQPVPIEAAQVTWIRGAFRCALAGDQRDALWGGGRVHGVVAVDARVAPVDGLDDIAVQAQLAAAGPDRILLGHIEPLWVQLRDQAPWLRVAVDDACLLGAKIRLASDEGARSVTLVEGTLIARLVTPQTTFAGVTARAADIGTRVGNVHAEAAVISARSLPVAAGGIAWADAQTGSDAPPGCAPIALGCAFVPLGCLGVPLAMFGLGAALWGGLGFGLGLGGIGFALALLLLPKWLQRRGWSWGGQVGLALTALAWALALGAASPLWLAWLQGDCSQAGLWVLGLLVAAALVGSASAVRVTRPVVLGLALLALALHGFADGGCVDGPIASAQRWAADETSRDADAERAARLQSGGGGRLTLDQALAMNWPPQALCGRTIHLSDELLFARNDAHLSRRGAPQLRKLAALMRRHPEASLRLVGHADSHGDPTANVVLSLHRARAVRAWLRRETGAAPTRIVASGLGASQPLMEPRSADDDASHRLNRRVEAVLDCAAFAADAVGAATADTVTELP